jgi:peptidoglycan hydrolase CwlO-like protein
MNKAVCVPVFCSVIMAACEHSALMQVRRDNTERAIRIAEKERELTIHEDQRTALVREQKNLLADLETKQMTVNELNAKLEHLRKENAQTTAETEAQQKKKESLESQLRKYQADLAAIPKDNRLPDPEKRKRIDELKKQISAHLKLMLAL